MLRVRRLVVTVSHFASASKEHMCVVAGGSGYAETMRRPLRSCGDSLYGPRDSTSNWQVHSVAPMESGKAVISFRNWRRDGRRPTPCRSRSAEDVAASSVHSVADLLLGRAAPDGGMRRG